LADALPQRFSRRFRPSEFHSNREYFLIGRSTVLLFYAAMSVGGTADTETVAWFVDADCLTAPAAAPAPRGGRSRARRDEARATSKRVVIASSLFLVLLAAALLIGGHAAIDPLLQTAVASRAAKGMGGVVYTMPDGIFCRHVSFDNATAEVTEGPLERCSGDIVRGRSYNMPTFTWGKH
jgi:hypothetical protein